MWPIIPCKCWSSKDYSLVSSQILPGNEASENYGGQEGPFILRFSKLDSFQSCISPNSSISKVVFFQTRAFPKVLNLSSYWCRCTSYMGTKLYWPRRCGCYRIGIRVSWVLCFCLSCKWDDCEGIQYLYVIDCSSIYGKLKVVVACNCGCWEWLMPSLLSWVKLLSFIGWHGCG